MALAPSVSRVLASTGTQVLAGWAELCTSSGMKWVDTSKQSPSEKAVPDAGHASMGEDCAYCRLVDLVPLVVLFLAFVLPRIATYRSPGQDDPPQRPLQNIRGLGSQGPPIFL